MAFEVIEQGRNRSIGYPNCNFVATVAAENYAFRIYWNESGTVEVSYDEYGVETGLKFADTWDKLKNRKSESTLKQHLIQWLHKKLYDAHNGRLINLCEHIKALEPYYDHDFNNYYEGTKEELIYKSIYGENDLVSEFGLTLNNDSPEKRKTWIQNIQFQMENVMKAINR